MPPIHPGEVLMQEYLERRISADTALRLARYFGTTERFWLNLQDRYDLEVERDRLATTLENIHPLASA
jgi:antitoxin HigA-1